MNSFPIKNSVLVLDNGKIYHDQELLDYLNAFGVKVEFCHPILLISIPLNTFGQTSKSAFISGSRSCSIIHRRVMEARYRYNEVLQEVCWYSQGMELVTALIQSMPR